MDSNCCSSGDGYNTSKRICGTGGSAFLRSLSPVAQPPFLWALFPAVVLRDGIQCIIAAELVQHTPVLQRGAKTEAGAETEARSIISSAD